MNEWAGYEPSRSVLCVCGWSGIFPNLSAANDAIERHRDEATTGSDHATSIESKPC